MSADVPIALLRTFISVVDLGSFTKAADALGRTQPAVSQQIRRLEMMLETKLLLTGGGGIRLTDSGVALGPFARQALRTNDDILRHFKSEALSGWIRVGLPTDFANGFLLDAATGFASSNPEVRIEVASRLSQELREALTADSLDLVVSIVNDGAPPYLVRSWEAQPVWAVPETKMFSSSEPLPILRHPDPCAYADRMISALQRIGRKWRTVYVSSDVAGLQNAVRCGLGVTALTTATVEDGMKTGTAEDGYPALDPLRIGLFYKHAKLSGAAHMLAQKLIACLDEAANCQNEDVRPHTENL